MNGARFGQEWPDKEAIVSQVIQRNGRGLKRLATLYEPIAESMEQVESILRAEMTSKHVEVDDMVRYGAMLGGKRLRPALMLLTARAIGEVTPEHLTLAAVVEMIHTATLIHDDVLDEAAVRRHQDTVNTRWGNKQSILLGDYLFSHAFYLSSTLESTFACRTIGRSTNIVCEGEMRQNASCANLQLSEEDYLSIIDAKTAELCACSCLLGAHYAGADQKLAQRMSQYGRSLGVAFQVIDDVLDVAGDEGSMGKSLGTDLHQSKPTLPLIHVWSKADASERRQIEQLLSNGRDLREGLAPWLEKYSAIEYATEFATNLCNRAREIAAELPESPAQGVLSLLPQFVVQRKI